MGGVLSGGQAQVWEYSTVWQRWNDYSFDNLDYLFCFKVVKACVVIFYTKVEFFDNNYLKVKDKASLFQRG